MELNPIGVIPRDIWEAQRLIDLEGAIKRYHVAGLKIPNKWIEEHSELVSKAVRKREEERQ